MNEILYEIHEVLYEIHEVLHEIKDLMTEIKTLLNEVDEKNINKEQYLANIAGRGIYSLDDIGKSIEAIAENVSNKEE